MTDHLEKAEVGLVLSSLGRVGPSSLSDEGQSQEWQVGGRSQKMHLPSGTEGLFHSPSVFTA